MAIKITGLFENPTTEEIFKDPTLVLVPHLEPYGKINMDVDFLSDWRSQTQKKYTFDYDLGNVYIVETDPFENNYNVKILIPTIKISCDENPDLNNNQRIKMDILDKIKQKFQQFGLNIILRATKFHSTNRKVLRLSRL